LHGAETVVAIFANFIAVGCFVVLFFIFFSYLQMCKPFKFWVLPTSLRLIILMVL